MKKPVTLNRRGNADETRARILEAATARFTEYNYENVSLRDISGDVGVDVALIGRYFKSKKNLFSVVLKNMLDPQFYTVGDRSTFGERIAHAILSNEIKGGDLNPMVFIIRAATSKSTQPIMTEIAYAQFASPMAKWLGGENAEIRVQFIAALIAGASIYKSMLPPSLSSKKGRKTYERQLALTLQKYVDG